MLKITVTHIDPVESPANPDAIPMELYAQTVERIDLAALTALVNTQPPKKRVRGPDKVKRARTQPLGI